MSSISLDKKRFTDASQLRENRIGQQEKENGVLTAEQVSSLVSLSPYELESKLAEIFCLTHYRVCLKEACLLDTYVSAFWFFTTNTFSNEQMLGVFSLLEVFLNNLKDNQMSLSDSIIVLRNNLKKFSEANSAGQPLYGHKQLISITDYINESFLQHYKLFQNLFSFQDDIDVIPVKLSIEVPSDAAVPFPPPLDEGIPEDIYADFLAEAPVQDTKDLEETKAPKIQSVDEDIPSDDTREKREKLLLSFKSHNLQNIVQEVSHEVLNDLRIGVDKKLKDRESQILPKIAKR